MINDVSFLDIEQARYELSIRDAALGKAHAVTPIFTWQTRTRGFAGLIRLIIEQQVSVVSANAIWHRLETGLGTVCSKHILHHSIDELKKYGLSTPKARYVYGIAQAYELGQLDFAELKNLDNDAAIAKLIALKGVGRWTAETYLMWCESRTDIFPAADLALQEALRILDGVAHRPTTQELYLRSMQWSPYRSVAVHLLWGYYTAIKKNIIPMPPGVPALVPLSRKKIS